MKKGSLDDSVFYSPPATNLPLWDVLPPSIPKESSERGAEQAKKVAKNQTLLILKSLRDSGCFAGSGYFLSRDQIIGRIPGLTVNAATGRLGPSGQLQTMKYIVAKENAAKSNAGNSVDGYQITSEGIAYAAKWRNAA